MYIIRLIREEHNREVMPPNTFLKKFDSGAFKGRGLLTTTSDITKAKVFKDREEIIRLWHGTSLRSYTILIELYSNTENN